MRSAPIAEAGSEESPAATSDSDRSHAEDTPASTTRRRFFFLGALAAASAVAPASAAAQQRRGTRKAGTQQSGTQRSAPQSRAKPPANDDPFPTVTPMEVLAPPANWTSPLTRLVRRATYGPTAEEMSRVRAMGYQAWLNQQVNYTRINNNMVETFVGTQWPLVNQEPEEIYNVSSSTVVNQLRYATLYRAAFSSHQLYERMVEFWSDHFNIATDKVGYLKVLDDREVIRRHAMGKFPDLVMASAKSPAMLAYLDQNRSRVGRPNENYARELMELHTVGVDGGYSQNDVVELSRVLTGWTYAGRGRFSFNASFHDWGAKTVMGMNIPAGSSALGQEGVREGERVIQMLVQHPATARFISTKMLRWLLTTEPSETQISTIASVYRSTGGDIKLMVRAILNSGWLPASPPRFKRPFHLLASGLRATNPSVTGLNTMNSQLNLMGHLTFDWETPDGYPDKVEYWAGNVLTRWNFASVLSTSNNATISIDMSPFSGSATSVVDAIGEHFFGGELDAATRSALISYLGAASVTTARIRETIALAMSSPSFQWY